MMYSFSLYLIMIVAFDVRVLIALVGLLHQPPVTSSAPKSGIPG